MSPIIFSFLQVGESDGTDGGARIYCTTDGGKTWVRNFWAPSTSTVHYSLIELRFSNDTDVWAVGGSLTQVAPSERRRKRDRGDEEKEMYKR